MTTLVLIAKEPVPGRVKTRLHPALSFEQAAEVAAAAIGDTLATLRDLPATRRILFFEGSRIPVGAEGYEVVFQPEGALDERLATIFDLVSEPMVLVGMDTPQLTPADLAPAFEWSGGTDAWFGPANDGGWWALALRKPDGALLRGVPTSRDDTGALQLARLKAAGLTVGMLPELVDVDTIDDALAVAAIAPHSRFAAALSLETAS